VVFLYDKKNRGYRILNVNVILELTHLFSSDSQKEKSGQSKKIFDLSASVPKAGIEPARPKAHDLPAGRQVLSRARLLSIK